MNMTSSGDLNKNIEFQSLVTTKNTIGEIVDSYVFFKSAWANIKPISSHTIIKYGRPVNEMTHTVRIRYDEDINYKMRIMFKNRPMTIKSIINVSEKNQFIDLIVEEVV